MRGHAKSPSAALAAIALFLILVPAAQASKGIVGYVGSDTSGSAAGQLNTPGGVAVNVGGTGGALPGDIYVVDRTNNRISQFTAAGVFVRAWGQDVVSTGQDQSNAIQAVRVDATGGAFTLTLGTSTTSDLMATATAGEIQSALNALPSISAGGGSVSVTGGPGSAGGTTPYIVTFDGGPLAGTAASQMGAATSVGNPLSGGASTVTVATMNTGGNGFEICRANPPSNDTCKAGVTNQPEDASASSGGLSSPQGIAVNQETGHVYVTQQTTRRVSEYSATGQFIRTFGQDVVRSGPDNATATNAVQTLTVTATGGAMDLTFGGKTASAVPYNVTAANLQTALRGLTSIGGSNVNVTSPVAGTYAITFAASLANNPEPLIEVGSNAGNPLTGGSASIANTTIGASGFEICDSSKGDVCQTGVSAATGGAFATGFNGYPAVAPAGAGNAGNVVVADNVNRRVQEFSSTGSFVRTFGFDVVSAGPNNTGTAFEICSAAAGDACKVAAASGAGVGQFGTNQPARVAVDTAGAIYTVESAVNFRIQKFTPQVGPPALSPAVFGVAEAPNGTSATNTPTDIAIGPANRVFVTKAFVAGATPTCLNGSPSIAERRVQELTTDGLTLLDTHMSCNAITASNGLAASPATGDLYVASTIGGQRAYIVGTNGPPSATLDTVTPTTSGAVVNGTISPNGPAGSPPNAVVATYQIEYKRSADSTWIPFASPAKSGPGFSSLQATVYLGGLEAKTSYDVRWVVAKPFGQGSFTTPPQTFQTLPVPPTIDAFSTSSLTAHSADLSALINPHGTDTAYHFEYGTTPDYGLQTPETPIGESFVPVPVLDHIDGLDPLVVYHFRVVASSSVGTTVSGDQTFNFYPPTCPNSEIRQQTGSDHLPDCRAYELVSPGETGNVILNAATFVPPYATSPPRFGLTGTRGAITGFDTINNTADPYVSTRTTTGWVTKYVSIPGSQTLQGTRAYGGLSFDKIMTFRGSIAPLSAPYVWSADGALLGRWPSSATVISNGDIGGGAWQPSPDFSHMAFSSNTADFDPEEHGLTTAPGSSYDYDVETDTVRLISKTPGGAAIPQEPGNSSTAEIIRFAGGAANGTPTRINPPVSTDGSQVLMSVRSTSAATSPVHLYMRDTNANLTYDVSRGNYVTYVGMTKDGSTVFFTAQGQLTANDTDGSLDLYRWTEANDSLTLISIGANGTGNSDSCATSWTTLCGIKVVTGTDEFDYPIATETGDIFFYSPEVLDADLRGLAGAQNIYDYHNGEIELVTTLKVDGSAPLTRFQVSSNGAHAAFITKSRVTSYNNAGFAEMYSYDRATGDIRCVSCVPDGTPPAHDIEGSTTGLFMSNDGRTFFTTADPLVLRDTDGLRDVYEFVDSRLQLITTGTAAVDSRTGGAFPTGLVGVSADGIDVFFSTFESLLPEDRNGRFLKFYVARTGGGFPSPFVPAPCVAADECHGAGSSPPTQFSIVSSSALGSGGNVSSGRRRSARRHRNCRRSRHGARHGRSGDQGRRPESKCKKNSARLAHR